MLKMIPTFIIPTDCCQTSNAIYFLAPRLEYIMKSAPVNTAAVDSLTTTKKFPEEPEFEKPIGNHTFSLGREAVLGCAVRNLGKHKGGRKETSEKERDKMGEKTKPGLELKSKLVMGPGSEGRSRDIDVGGPHDGRAATADDSRSQALDSGVDSRQRPAAHASTWRSGIGLQLTRNIKSPTSASSNITSGTSRRGRARRPRGRTQAVLRACLLPNTRAVRRTRAPCAEHARRAPRFARCAPDRLAHHLGLPSIY
ncbi:hypothetical protein EVAR_80079_1 [Eumeta japonica]|uniref:Uncharacterized protein n=1 Tax=Eumeta variegata TaxID=151549 RepID=A0A4C1UE48_EUMVA|nr:hypothetical protein EVAR_80079_1 [Eumeta japonica]